MWPTYSSPTWISTNHHQSSPKEGGGGIEPPRHIASSPHGPGRACPKGCRQLWCWSCIQRQDATYFTPLLSSSMMSNHPACSDPGPTSLFKKGPLCSRMVPRLPAWVFDHTATCGGGVVGSATMSSVTNILISDMDLYQPSPEFAQRGKRWDWTTTAHSLLTPWDTHTIVPTPRGKEAFAKNGHFTTRTRLPKGAQATLMPKLHPKTRCDTFHIFCLSYSSSSDCFSYFIFRFLSFILFFLFVSFLLHMIYLNCIPACSLYVKTIVDAKPGFLSAFGFWHLRKKNMTVFVKHVTFISSRATQPPGGGISVALGEAICEIFHGYPWDLTNLKSQLLWRFRLPLWPVDMGDWFFYHYWCWRVRGPVPVKTSTDNNFPRKYHRIPRNY